MKNIRHIVCSLILLFAYSAWAESFVISDIRVEGLQRVSAGSVFGAISVNVGDNIDESAVRQISRDLFATGLFEDIAVAREGGVLVIGLVERPSISEINIDGNKSIKTESLLEGLGNSGLAEGEVFKRATLERIRLELERQYSSQGRYSATIEAEVDDLPRNRVAINIEIDEGEVAGINHLNVVGNTLFSDDDLLELFELKLPGLLSFYTNDDKYSQEKLSGDLERLESYYKDRGYINFTVESTQVTISPSKEDVYITVNISEGKKFSVSEVDLAGELVVDEAILRLLTLVKPEQTFSQILVTRTEELMTDALGNLGYTFAEVNAIPEIDNETQQVSLRFYLEPGRRAYVRRVEFRGNTGTTDEVLRREMRQMEGGWASNSQIELGKVRLQRLGFFKEVDVETPSVPGVPDQIDVMYNVEEQSSGSIQASVGFAQGSGLILGTSISQNNFLGTGNSVSFGINVNRFQDSYNFSFFDPYYTVDGVSRGFNVFFRQTDYGDFNISDYSTDALGASVNFGYPISEIEALNFSLGIENNKIDEGISPDQEVSQFLLEEGDNHNIFTLTGTWRRSTLNRGQLATRGASQNFSIEATLPGSDLQYFKARYEAQWFKPLTRNFILHLRTQLGYGDSYGSTNTLPFYKHFYAGGFGSIRGYESNSLGPKSTPADLNSSDPALTGVARDPNIPGRFFPGTVPGNNSDNDDQFGGNALIEFTAEILFPLPFIKDQRSIRSAIFIDGGNVYNTNCPDLPSSNVTCTDDLDLGALRYSAGIGVTWITGFGPLTFSLASPFGDETGDDTEVFSFSIGSTF